MREFYERLKAVCDDIVATGKTAKDLREAATPEEANDLAYVLRIIADNYAPSEPSGGDTPF